MGDVAENGRTVKPFPAEQDGFALRGSKHRQRQGFVAGLDIADIDIEGFFS